MNHLDFIIWMLGFPFIISIDDYLDAKTKEIIKEKPTERSVGYALFMICMWFITGAILY